MDREARLARIYETIREIPAGRVASYGQIAEIAGIPRGARQVGWAVVACSATWLIGSWLGANIA